MGRLVADGEGHVKFPAHAMPGRLAREASHGTATLCFPLPLPTPAFTQQRGQIAEADRHATRIRSITYQMLGGIDGHESELLLWFERMGDPL